MHSFYDYFKNQVLRSEHFPHIQPFHIQEYPKTTSQLWSLEFANSGPGHSPSPSLGLIWMLMKGSSGLGDTEVRGPICKAILIKTQSFCRDWELEFSASVWKLHLYPRGESPGPFGWCPGSPHTGWQLCLCVGYVMVPPAGISWLGNGIKNLCWGHFFFQVTWWTKR